MISQDELKNELQSNTLTSSIAQPTKIVVITPVKNEAWILDRFLAVTSQFADHIIIADQNSTDESKTICKQYPKVTIVENQSEQYHEGDRQILLIQKAREIVPNNKIILALDADEILAANATKTLGWQSMLKAQPGTVVCFEKLNLYSNPYQCIRYDSLCPIGYVDDGAEHKPQPIHSIRVPTPDYAIKLHINDVKILHYAPTRLDMQRSKARLYSVIDRTLPGGNKRFMSRRAYYGLQNCFAVYDGELEPSLPEWFIGWEELGIDMYTIPTQTYYWQDFEVLKYFQKYGYHHFWLEDIWDFDWEAFRLYAKSRGMKNIPDHKILAPPKILSLLADSLTSFYKQARKLIKAAK
jgi:glycosyltransferase involved in cell wall biosynthesis